MTPARIGDYWIQNVHRPSSSWPLDPRADEIYASRTSPGALSDALPLATGTRKFFYSVAQHSVYVSRQVPKEFALEGLLHDAAEAYCGDMIRPLKRGMAEYQLAEQRIADMIGYRFEVDCRLFDTGVVKHADYAVGEAEKRWVMGPARTPWESYPNEAPIHIVEWSPAMAEAAFLARFAEISRERGRRVG